jgi:trk system potassium uptake protein
MYIIVAGCRKVGSNLAIALAQEDHDVVVIDSDPENFRLLGSGFNGLTISGMPIDEDILRSAGIEKADALAAVSNDDNMNVMITEVAKNIFHVPKVITRVYDPAREPVFNKMGITTICPTSLAVEKIRDYLVDTEFSQRHQFQDRNIAFRYYHPNKNAIGKTISQVENEFIFGLVRDGSFLLQTPDQKVEENDLLVIADYADPGI